MNNWKQYTVDSIVDVLTDYTANGSFEALKLNVKYYNETNYAALVRTTDLEKRKFKPERFTDKKGYDFQKKSALYGGEIVMANVGSVGNIYKVPNYPMPMTLAPNMFLIKFDESVAVNDYMYYWMNSEDFVNQLFSSIGSTTLLAINKGNLRKIKVSLPPVRSQQKTAKILQTVDGQIEKTEAIIAKYKAIKQGLMQDLFTRGIDVATGKLRPRYQDAPELYKPSPLGMIPKEWDVQKLNELTNLIIDGTHFTPKYTERGIPFLRVTDIQQDEIDKKRIKFISEEEHQLLTKRCKPEIDDILLSKNGTIGITKVVDWDWDFSIFVSLCLIKPKHKLILSNFLSNQISSFVVFEQIRRRSKQGTVTNLHLEEIREFDILLPKNKLEQEQITERVLRINSTIRNEESNLQKLQQLKKGLMSDLLSGKVRVHKDEEAVC